MSLPRNSTPKSSRQHCQEPSGIIPLWFRTNTSDGLRPLFSERCTRSTTGQPRILRGRWLWRPVWRAPGTFNRVSYELIALVPSSVFDRAPLPVIGMEAIEDGATMALQRGNNVSVAAPEPSPQTPRSLPSGRGGHTGADRQRDDRARPVGLSAAPGRWR